MLADVGFVGLPSVGKSTLLSKISAAKPKIGAYHFTTLSPNLGMVKTKDGRSFVAADLPGLIEGASTGVGLGDKFLKHIERTKLIVHIVDMSGIEGDPYDNYLIIRKELEDYSSKLSNKEEIIVANKMDIEGSEDNLKEFKKKIKKDVIEISAITNTGIDELLIKIADKLDSIENTNLYNDDEIESHILYEFKEEKPFTIEKDGDVFVIHSEKIEKLFKMTKFTDEGVRRFSNKLRRLGVDDELRNLGIKEGDLVRILNYEFEYTE